QVSGPRDPDHQPTPAEALRAFFEAKGVRRPLLWIYNFNYRDFIRSWAGGLKVFHATEDYTLGADSVRYFEDVYRNLVLAELQGCDLMVAVSPAVEANYVRAASFTGRSMTLRNGCDFAFWLNSDASTYQPRFPRRGLLDRMLGRTPQPRPSIFYQGGINERLDFDLIDALAGRMTDFDFDFCGPVDESEKAKPGMAGWWKALRRPNVHYHGMLTPEQVAARAQRASVAITPYRDTPLIAVSLPLKSYEYLACGLPVVTAPIPSLEAHPDQFTFARTARDYERAIRRLAPTRDDPVAVGARLATARTMDYDLRFEELEAALCSAELEDDAAAGATANGEPGGVPIAKWGPEDLQCQDAWREAGASVIVKGDEARVCTPMDAWNFGATLRLSALDSVAGSVRLSVRVHGVQGEVLMSIYDEATSQSAFEIPLAAVAEPAEYQLDLDEVRGRLLLFRNGQREGGASFSFVDARLSVRST
ncbi:MAG: tuaH, partial [Caulobacteraceae bacterium]|nr:tuaH [Caulobacteraceae bacterium]